ncbi:MULTISPECIES: hypothetical protein [Klebsiella]|uniref:hypothetical protein n=1 Tax=Klebsiella TaxID=570 RepID=UPI001F4D1196|nr:MULTISPECIES: hypothetical protein [Klebsiella]UNF63687.1 hypothetical protein MMY94_19375 [Klebsiella michiganensis]HBS1106656.1 hypothetical protein [Klebsiella pneumoniae]HDX4349814.1 hypothetical protein [Klebsiella michiganensis]HDX8907359.1 hypothetical protein [Klebsiella michiganensis]
MASIVLFFVYVMFFIPKMDLISLGGGFNAGLRIDDLIICLLFFFFFLYAAQNKKTKVSKTEFYFILFLFVTSLGSFFSSTQYGRGTVLFPIRFFEYFVFFYMGFFLYKGGANIRKLLLLLLIANSVVAILQHFGVVGGFNVRGYQPNMSERVIGLTSGPWELGVILNFITCYFLAEERSEFKKYVIFGIATLIIMMTGSRMSMLAQIAVLIWYMKLSASLVTIIKRCLVVIPLLFAVYFFFSDSTVATRSDSLMNSDNIDQLLDSYSSVRITESVPSWGDLGVLSRGDEVDASWSMRGIKWIYAVKLYLSHPMYWMIGVGAGSFGNALDGGWLRITTETGIIGLILFILFLLRIKRLSPTMSLCVIAFCINMLMIDIYMSYKVMSMMLLLAGYYQKKKKTERALIRQESLNNHHSTFVKS